MMRPRRSAAPSACAADKITKGRRRANRGRGSWFYRSVVGVGGSQAVFLHVACARDLSGCESFANVGKASVLVVDSDSSEEEEKRVPVKASALRALLLKGPGPRQDSRRRSVAQPQRPRRRHLRRPDGHVRDDWPGTLLRRVE